MDKEELLNRFESTKDRWHSPIDLGYGIVTKNARVQRRFMRRLKLMDIPQDLSGKTVLDIGAWDGFFSFEFERRGAKRVLAIDTYAWDKGGLDCFLLAREQLKSKVEYKRLDVHDLSPNDVGKFDLVFCAGVLYHLKNPLLALEKIYSVTNNLLICDTHAMLLAVHEKFPLIAYFPGDENTKGPWKVCGYPTMTWVDYAIRGAGFSRVEFKYTPSMRWYKKIKALITNCPQTGRFIVHAFV